MFYDKLLTIFKYKAGNFFYINTYKDKGFFLYETGSGKNLEILPHF